MIDLSRSEALLGADTMSRLRSARIAVVGVGGWCAEALVRTGACRLTLVDDDVVAPSNVNRQGPATAATIGRVKVEAMRERLLAINPSAEIDGRAERFTGATDGAFFAEHEVIVDAIDSVDCKAELILGATAAGVPVVSSMGAALRLDPTEVVVRRFDRVEGDGLARALRRRFRLLRRFPSGNFNCVCSLETPAPVGCEPTVRPSYMPVTCAFGMALAAEVIRILKGEEKCP